MMSRVLHITKLLYTPVSFCFILYFSWLNRTVLVKLFDIADFSFFVIAVCLWCLLHLISPLSPQIIFASLGSKIAYKDLLRIYILRLPARYLPGGVWHTVGRLSDYHTFGISKKHLTLLVVVETFFPCLITLFIGGGYLYFAGGKNMLTAIEGSFALISLITLFLIPFVAKWRLSSILNNTFIYYSLLILLSVFFWIIASSSFLFYYNCVSLDTSPMSYIRIAATYIFSWGIGYISIFAPQGIGVFEVVAGKIMALPMSLGGAIAFLAGFRIVVLMADMLVWGLYRFLNLFMRGTCTKK